MLCTAGPTSSFGIFCGYLNDCRLGRASNFELKPCKQESVGLLSLACFLASSCAGQSTWHADTLRCLGCCAEAHVEHAWRCAALHSTARSSFSLTVRVSLVLWSSACGEPHCSCIVGPPPCSEPCSEQMPFLRPPRCPATYSSIAQLAIAHLHSCCAHRLQLW
jgi:hypothetical protein